MLNLMFQRNASKFAILLGYENLHVFFRFSFHATYRHRPGHLLGKKKYIARNEKRRKLHWFLYSESMWQILKCFAGNFCRAQILKL